MPAAPQFSKDIVPLTDLKVNLGRIVRQVDETHRPVLLTSRGRGVAVQKHRREPDPLSTLGVTTRSVASAHSDANGEQGRHAEAVPPVSPERYPARPRPQ